MLTRKMNNSHKKELIVAPYDRCFWLHQGGALYTLIDLLEALRTMTADVFAHHVNKAKNDFAPWVREVLHDEDLGKKLLKNRTIATARQTIESHLKKLYRV